MLVYHFETRRMPRPNHTSPREDMSRLNDLIRELHRRSLWQVLLIYVGGALFAYQAVQALTEGLGLPPWFPGLAVGLFIVGLPIVVATACVRQEPTPAGGREAPATETVSGEARREALARRRRLLTWRNAGLSMLVALALWGVAATAWMVFGSREVETAAAGERPSVAVLPLENRSGLEEDRYFTDGIHDEILTQLNKISGLSVKSRTSVMEYRDSPKNIREIGEELDARYLMEGGVQRAGQTVRINVQLIDAESDDHVFAETYDREMSLENLLAVQREVALRIADALETTLTTEERERIEKVPTENPEAYDYYLKGLEYLYGRPGLREENARYAQQMLERAVELDPGFAEAYARLAHLHVATYEFAHDRSEDRLTQAREAAKRALEIDPHLSWARFSLAYYYYATRGDDRALEQLEMAERGQPGLDRVAWLRGMILRRQGEWDEALNSFERALTLSPREPSFLFYVGDTYLSLRRYDLAEIYFDSALALEPDFLEVALVKAMVPLYGRGDTGPLRALLADMPPGFDPWGLFTLMHGWVEYLDRDYAAALDVLSDSEEEYLEIPGGIASVTVLRAYCHAWMGRIGRARATADSARRDLEARLSERPDDPDLHGLMGVAQAFLGRRDAAVRAAQRAVELRPISEDAVEGPGHVDNLATVYAVLGEVDAAVEQFDRYLSVPAPHSIEYILLDPGIDPIRDDPRFQALVEKYAGDRRTTSMAN
jgi:serine/threonine-protein kinase